MVTTLVAIAVRFTEIRGTAWRVKELDDLTGCCPAPNSAPDFRPVTRPPVGWINQDDGRIALGAAVPLGVLPARVAEYLARPSRPRW